MSTQRSFAVAKKNLTNVFTPTVIVYRDSVLGDDMPIPFTVKNGVLDISVQDNVTANLLTAATFTDSIDEDTDVDYQASIMGGLSLVRSLGPNMLIFLKNFINAEEDTATNDLTEDITIHTAPIMTNLKFNDLGREDPFRFSDTAPIASVFDLTSSSANASNNYRVVAIFKSPLVVKFKYDGNVKYLTFSSACDSV